LREEDIVINTTIKIEVECNNVLESYGDILALKHAQETYGVDEIVFGRLKLAGFLSQDNLPKPKDFHLVQANGAVAATAVLFVGTVPLPQFTYEDIRDFARLSLTHLAESAPSTKVFLATLHGTGYGLDETEAFESEVAGFVDAISAGNFPESLRTIKIVTRDPGQAKRLATTLVQLLPDNLIPVPGSDVSTLISDRSADIFRSVGYNSASKPFVFVAMPFANELDDVFHYGIKEPIKSAGFLCERADELSFTGDIMEHVKKRIEQATFVVADLTGANPNVYLEVGYAWGLRRRTILLVNDSDALKFDISGQRCLVYKSIRDLEKMLSKELANLSCS
jgi:hypothetical protein